MTDSAPQPNDINTRFETIEEEIATIKSALSTARQENQINSSSILSLQSTMADMAGMIATLGRATNDLRQSVATISRENQRIWEYLRERNGGSSPPV